MTGGGDDLEFTVNAWWTLRWPEAFRPYPPVNQEPHRTLKQESGLIRLLLKVPSAETVIKIKGWSRQSMAGVGGEGWAVLLHMARKLCK